MRVLRGCIIVLALGPGLFMTFDGLRVGLEPRSPTMKIVFVLLGVAWLVAIGGFLRRTRWSSGALAVLAVATLWYLPVGTLMSALVLIGLVLLGRRPDKSPQREVEGHDS